MGEIEILDAIKEVRADIKTYRTEARQDNKDIWLEINYIKKCQSESELTAEKRNGRLHVLEQSSKRAEKTNGKIEKHLNNDVIHFNREKAMETSGTYLARKKLYFALLGLLTVILTLLTAYLQSLI